MQNKAVGNLTEASHVQEREKAAAQRDARMKKELAASLEETLRQVKNESEQLSKMLKDVEVSNMSSAGSVENARRVNSGEIDFGIARHRAHSVWKMLILPLRK